VTFAQARSGEIERRFKSNVRSPQRSFVHASGAARAARARSSAANSSDQAARVILEDKPVLSHALRREARQNRDRGQPGLVCSDYQIAAPFFGSGIHAISNLRSTLADFDPSINHNSLPLASVRPPPGISSLLHLPSMEKIRTIPDVVHRRSYNARQHFLIVDQFYPKDADTLHV
jgi:hypothetical protein